MIPSVRIVSFVSTLIAAALGVACEEQPRAAVPETTPPAKLELPSTLPPDHPITKELHILREMVHQRALLLEKQKANGETDPRLGALDEAIRSRIENLDPQIAKEQDALKKAASGMLEELKSRM
jgi:hypothetical protein